MKRTLLFAALFVLALPAKGSPADDSASPGAPATEPASSSLSGGSGFGSLDGSSLIPSLGFS